MHRKWPGAFIMALFLIGKGQLEYSKAAQSKVDREAGGIVAFQLRDTETEMGNSFTGLGALSAAVGVVLLSYDLGTRKK
jgi:hypothetical protein